VLSNWHYRSARLGPKCQILAKQEQTGPDRRKLNHAKMPNLCQFFAKMPFLCQIHARWSRQPRNARLRPEMAALAKWARIGLCSNAKFMPILCQFHAKMPFSCQIHARWSRQHRNARLRPEMAALAKCQELYYAKMPNLCQIYANLLPKCHFHAKFMPDGPGSPEMRDKGQKWQHWQNGQELYYGKMPNYANFMPKCHFHAKIMPDGPGSPEMRD